MLAGYCAWLLVVNFHTYEDPSETFDSCVAFHGEILAVGLCSFMRAC
jgi:hypothetical protein